MDQLFKVLSVVRRHEPFARGALPPSTCQTAAASKPKQTSANCPTDGVRRAAPVGPDRPGGTRGVGSANLLWRELRIFLKFTAAFILILAFSANCDVAFAEESGGEVRTSRAARTGSPETIRPVLIKDTRSLRAHNSLGLVAGASDLTELTVASELSTVLASKQETGPNGELALRVVPIVGRGGLQNVRDVLTLPGADMGIAPTALLEQLRRSKELGDISRKIVYIAPLYGQEFHVIAGAAIQNMRDLAGKVVNLGENDGTERLARDLFGALQISATWVNIGHREALEQIRKGEIAATVLISGKSVPVLSGYKREDGVHFLSVDLRSVTDKAVLKNLEEDYLPTTLTPADYPNLIRPDEVIDTLVVSSVLFAYNWPARSDRHRLLTDFVRTLFPRIMEFHKETYHPKWREINLNATLPGWSRFSGAERWLEQQARSEAEGVASRVEFERFLDVTGSVARTQSERDRLFREFLQWRKQKRSSGSQ